MPFEYNPFTQNLDKTTDSLGASAVTVDDTNFDVFTETQLQALLEEADALFLNARSTGVRFGGALTDQGSGVVRISAGAGELLNNSDPENPVYTQITWAQTDLDLSSTDDVYYIYVNASGTVTSTTTAPTHADYRGEIYLHRVYIRSGVVSGKTAIVMPLQQYGPQIWDLFRALGPMKRGISPSAASNDLTIAISAGDVYEVGSNFYIDPENPHEISISAQNPVTFRHVLQDGTQGPDETDLDVSNYDNGGTLTAIPGAAGRATIFTLKLFSGSSNFRFFYGQEYYDNVDEAYTALIEGTYNPTFPSAYDEAMTIGWIIAEKSATDLSDGTQTFISSNRFGLLGGGVTTSGANALLAINNLSDITDIPTAQQNLNLEVGVDVQEEIGGATLTSATVAGDDKVLIQDTDDTDSLKTVTAQSIADLGGGGSVGGLYGMNVETLTGNKTLTPNTDEIYQNLNTNGTARNITLDTGSATAGDRFVIKNTYSNTSTTATMLIYQSATVLTQIPNGGCCAFIFDGTNWLGEVYNYQNDTSLYNLAIGKDAYASPSSTAATTSKMAIGHSSTAIGNASTALGVSSSASALRALAIGVSANASGSTSVAIGGYAASASGGASVSIGNATIASADNTTSVGSGANASAASATCIGVSASANSLESVIAIGHRSRGERKGETVIHFGTSATAQNDYITGSVYWRDITTNSTPVEMFLLDSSNTRLTLINNSAMTFTILVTARDNTSGDCASYKFEGGIKRGASAATTALIGSITKTVIGEDDASWDIDFTADTTNGALIPTITGDATNTVRWCATAWYTELRF